MSYPETDKEVLTAARNLINQGWCQNDFRIGTDLTGNRVSYASRDRRPDVPVKWSYCALGGIKAALGWWEPQESQESWDAVLCRYPQLARKVDKFLPAEYERNLDKFNDAESTTKEDVIALFDKAIEAEEDA